MSIPLEPQRPSRRSLILDGGEGISLKNLREARRQVDEAHKAREAIFSIASQPMTTPNEVPSGLVTKYRANGPTERQLNPLLSIPELQVKLQEQSVGRDVEAMKREELDALYGAKAALSGPRHQAPKLSPTQQKAAKAKRRAAKKGRKNNR